jgi:O-antigen/teichoic acid export membrane protein
MTETAEAYNVPRGAAYFTSQQVVSYLASFLFYITLARLLVPEEIGQVSLLAATLAIFNTITQLALPAAATRYISSSLGRGERNTAGSVVKTTLRFTLTLGAAGAVVAILFSPLIGAAVFNTDVTILLVTVFMAGFILDLTALYAAFFLGAGLYAQTAYQSILYTPLSRGLGLALTALGLGVFGVVAGWALGGLVTLLVSVYMWHNRLPASTHYTLRPLLAFTLPLFASTLINLGQQWGDIALLQALLGNLSTTGTYYIVVSSVGFLSVLWIPVSSALYPALSAYHSTNNKQGITDRLHLAFRLTNLAVLPLSTALAAVSATALEVAYGPAYTQQTTAFTILTLTSIFTAQAAILTATLQATGKTHSLLQITLAATVIDLATVALTARILGPAAGALGRTLLYITSVALSRGFLRPIIRVHVFRGFRHATILALGVGIPLFLIDQLLISPQNLTIPFILPPVLGWIIGPTNLAALLRLPILLVVFLVTFLLVSRKTRIFRPQDFAILKDALPRRLHPYLRTLEHLIVGRTARSTDQVP